MKTSLDKSVEDLERQIREENLRLMIQIFGKSSVKPKDKPASSSTEKKNRETGSPELHHIR